AVKLLLHAEHVHGAALALGIAAAATGELGHHALGVHAGGEHMAVIAIAGDDLVAVLQRHLHADHHGLLADIEMAETADRAHAVELAGLLLKAANQEHVAERLEFLLLAECRWGAAVGLVLRGACGGFLGCGHGNSGSEKTFDLSNLTQTRAKALRRHGMT